MKEIYCIKCKKFVYIFSITHTLVISVICGKCGTNCKRLFKEEELTEI